ncbi:hypothetical protein AB0J82_10480 [Asanoa sp. NPDC049518]|uniref:hypothetical protein n=1 Tax=unclassified Asanoa TaxID=2685164 RepID=UPI00343668D9
MVFRKVLAVGTGVVAVSALWFELTYSGEPGSWESLVVRMLPWALLLVPMVVLAVLEARPSRTVEFALVEDEQALRTRLKPEAVWWPALVAVGVTAAFWSVSPSTWEDSTDPAEWQLTVVDVVATTTLGLATLAFLGVQLYTLWAGLPAVVLSTHGVRLRSPLGYRVVPWDALRPGYPRRPGRKDRFLHLAVERGHGARRRGLALVPLPWLDIHPWFLADTIRYYAEHPEHRAAIGTPEEHDRLLVVTAAP